MKNVSQSISRFFNDVTIKRPTHLIRLFTTAVFLSVFIPLTAQVVYTDVVPDYEIPENSNYDIDINNDGIIDFEIDYEYIYQWERKNHIIKIIAKGLNQVAVSNESASVFSDDELIDENLNWSSEDEVLMFSENPFEKIGNWIGVEKGYLGVRIKIDQVFYYSWIRIFNAYYFYDLEAYFRSEMVVDYAYKSSSGLAIEAGQGMPAEATSVFGQDISNYFDGRDIQYSFTKARDELDYSEYRIVLAKASDSTVNDLEVMNQLQVGQYTAIEVDTTDHEPFLELTFSETTLDKDGDSLFPLTKYRIHLLNVAASGNPSDNKLSTPSPEFFLQAFCNEIKTLAAFDSGDNHDAGDIEVYFTKADESQFIKEYRIYVSPASNTSSLLVDTALSLSNNHYTTVLSSNSNINLKLNPNQMDVDGNFIHDDIFYKIYILSVADSIYSIISAISESSRKFILTEPDLLYAGQEEGDKVRHFVCDSLFCSSDNWLYYIGNDTVDVDLNRDGLNDFKLISKGCESTGGTYYEAYIMPYRSNAILVCDHPEHDNWVDVLNKYELIGEGYNRSNSESLLEDYGWSPIPNVFYYYGHGQFPYNKYLGFVLMDNDVPQYAWLKMQNGYFIEYGFQDINSAVDTNSTENQFEIFPNPTSEFLQIQKRANEALNEDYLVSMVNSQGIVVGEFTFSGATLQRDIKKYPSGIYLLVFQQKGKIIESKRFIVQ